MPLIVGDLLTDPAAQSFIGVAEADAYLAPEQRAAWDLAANVDREAALVQASRWLAATYRFRPLDAYGLSQVGKVAARLAAETIGDGALNLFAGVNTSAAKKSIKAGSVAIEFHDPLSADAAGRAWAWLPGMLGGLIYQRGLGIGAIVV